MSWFLLNRNLTLLEPYDWKLSRTVLRGERGSNASDLPGKCFDRLEAETQNAYFYTATRNTCLNRLKHLRVEQQHLDTLREVTRMDVNTGYRQHEAQLQQAETIACSLSEPTRTILRLCYWEKLTYRQVAERLEISPDTVKKHISKALRILRNEMNGKEETNGTERG